MKINLQEKRYYSIGEVASKFNVNPSLIRFWEQEFKILNPKKDNRKINKTMNNIFLKVKIEVAVWIVFEAIEDAFWDKEGFSDDLVLTIELIGVLINVSNSVLGLLWKGDKIGVLDFWGWELLVLFLKL